MAYFPMFIELKDSPCLIVGGGKIAERKLHVLMDFEADITILAPEFTEEIIRISEDSEVTNVKIIKNEYNNSYLDKMKLVIAATDDEKLNSVIATDCKERNIQVNAVDQIDDCTFIFPSYLKKGDVVAAFSSGGNSPVITQYLKQQNNDILTDNIGDIAAFLGAIRQLVKQKVDGESNRKKVYQELLKIGLENDRVPTSEEVTDIIINMSKERQ